MTTPVPSEPSKSQVLTEQVIVAAAASEENVTVPADTNLAASHFLVYTRQEQPIIL